jgi:hypothetical protein
MNKPQTMIALLDLIGKTIPGDISEDEVRAIAGGPVRFIAPGAIVTADYRTDRVNVDMDANGTIIGVRVG